MDADRRDGGGELAHRVGTDALGERPTRIVVVADAAARPRIAARLRVPSVEALSVEFALRRLPGRVFAADGVLRAAVTRECVVTLDPFVERVEERFEVEFVPAARGRGAPGDDAEDAAAGALDPDAPDRIPYEGEVLELGEAAVEQLALALDPFPRRPGAQLDPAASGAADEAAAAPSASVHPFADLAARLRRE